MRRKKEIEPAAQESATEGEGEAQAGPFEKREPVKVSLIAGAGAWFLWTAFVHLKESAPLGISKLLFGTDALLGMPWQVVDPLVIALPLSAVALAAAALYEHTTADIRSTEEIGD